MSVWRRIVSGRCKACNCIMSEQDMKNKWPNTNEYTDLCYLCLDIAHNPDDLWDDDDLDIDGFLLNNTE